MKKFVLVLLIFIGIILRFLVASWGHTYDMNSYEIVGRIVIDGGNVYAQTTRYNYGPFWFMVLGALYKIAQWFPQPLFFFRYSVVTLLICFDVAIFYFLKRRISQKAGLLYFFNPLSILVTGYYSQFDAIAVYFGLLAVDRYGSEGPITSKRKFGSLVLLGVSLIWKHVLFAFPLWIAVRQRRFSDKVITIAVPTGIFFLSFLPFVQNGLSGILNNVFFYLSFNNAPLWHVLMPDRLKLVINPYVFFFVPLILGAFIFRKKNLLDALLYYGIILVLFSLAISEQYFVTVLPFISVYFNPFFAVFSFVQTLFMLLMVNGGEMYVSVLRMMVDRAGFGFSIQMILLLFGFLIALFYKSIRKFSTKDWITTLSCLLLSFIALNILPNIQEDRKVSLIENAINIGDYESANRLYINTQKSPPFAGSRFWNKLTRVRYYIEYYRSYRKAKDLFDSRISQTDIHQISILLKGMPAGFPYGEDVRKMLEFAKYSSAKQ